MSESSIETIITSFSKDEYNDSFSSFDSEKSTSAIEIEVEYILDNSLTIENKIDERIKTISLILERLIRNNSSKNDCLNNLTEVFNNEEVPEISLYNYLMRIKKYTKCEENTLILSLIYLDKICLKKINLSINNIYKFLFTSILLAIKFNEDRIYKNNYYAYILGISPIELNLMEKNFLELLEYQLFVKDNVFNTYKKALL